MKSSTFQSQNEKRWQELEEVLDELDSRRVKPETASRLPKLFRQVCSDLSLAQYRMYGMALCDRINGLVIRAYKHLYKGTMGTWARIFEFIWFDLPGKVRQEWKLFWLCNAMFWIPGLIIMASSFSDPRWVQAILGPSGMASLEQGFGHDAELSDLRNNFGSNFAMFMFYIRNNVGIDFRTFAGGILGGIGTIFFIVFNGIHMGAAFGYVYQACDPANFYNWISGHSAPEFLGMILSGVAGMKLGLALISPGRHTRPQALLIAGKTSIVLLFGAAMLTFLAAVIEGFWSPQEIPVRIKYAFGNTLWVTLFAYLFLAGRGRQREA